MSVKTKKTVKFKYEKLVIDPILKAIKKHQEYLTKPENLPQLAKLGYIYNTLWYNGRVCWGYEGRIQKNNDCEDNPKYKIEMCDPADEDIENLIYDAWGMHVSNDFEEGSYEVFSSLIREGREYSDYENRLKKVNKNFDEWVDVLTDPEGKYSDTIYKNRRDVANHLLLCIGNGYGVNKDGFIISEASGADQDVDLYGEWENAKFGKKDIQSMVDKILSYPEVEKTFVAAEAAHREWKENKKKSNRISDVDPEEMIETIKTVLAKGVGKLSDEKREMFEGMLAKYQKEAGVEVTVDIKKKEMPYRSYYPISKYSLIHIHNNKEKSETLEPSAVDECINVCKEILDHKDKEEENNVEFAKKFLLNNGFEEYRNQVPKEIDKYAVRDKFLKNFEPIQKGSLQKYPDRKWFPQSKSLNHYEMEKEGAVSNFYLNDTKENDYADNNLYGTIFLDKGDLKSLGKGYFNDIECLKHTKFYTVLKKAVDDTLAIEEVKSVFFYVENTDKSVITMKFEMSDKQDIYLYTQDTIDSENEFCRQGFGVGENAMCLYLEDLGLFIDTSKAKPLGTTHPDNKKGQEYFGNNQHFDVYDKDWKKINGWRIDERGFNTFSGGDSKRSIGKWLHDEHASMKANDPDYGTDDNEGIKDLYAHDFMKWLEANQGNYKK